MIRSNLHHYSRIILALLLIGVLMANNGYQFAATDTQDPLAMDVCDHSESEKEHDKKESGESDDLISHDAKSYTFILNYLSINNDFSVPGYLNNHPEIVCPPPEYYI